MRGFEVPDRVPEDAEFTATVTVGNVGERDGTFRGTLGDAAMSAQPLIAVDVPAGTTTESSHEVRARFGESAELTVVLILSAITSWRYSAPRGADTAHGLITDSISWQDYWDQEQLTRTVRAASA